MSTESIKIQLLEGPQHEEVRAELEGQLTQEEYGLRTLQYFKSEMDLNRQLSLLNDEHLSQQVPGTPDRNLSLTDLMDEKKQEIEGQRKLGQLYLAKALGIEVDYTLPTEEKPVLEHSFKSETDTGRFVAAYTRFRRKYYDPNTIDGTINRVSESEEELQFTSDLEKSLSAKWAGEAAVSQSKKEYPEELKQALVGFVAEHNPNGLTPNQREALRGAVYLFAAQSAIGILNSRIAYMKKQDVETFEPTPSAALKDPNAELNPYQNLHEHLIESETEDIKVFIDLCILRGAGYAKALKIAGLLPKEILDGGIEDKHRVLETYLQHLSSPPKKVHGKVVTSPRLEHTKALKKAIEHPSQIKHQEELFINTD